MFFMCVIPVVCVPPSIFRKTTACPIF
jgi:hypothetical protein